MSAGAWLGVLPWYPPSDGVPEGGSQTWAAGGRSQPLPRRLSGSWLGPHQAEATCPPDGPGILSMLVPTAGPWGWRWGQPSWGMFSTGHCLACPPLAHGREGPCLGSQGSPLPFKGAMDTQPGQVLLEGPGIKYLPSACVWWGQMGAGAGACADFWLPASTPIQRLRTSRWPLLLAYSWVPLSPLAGSGSLSSWVRVPPLPFGQSGSPCPSGWF